MLLLMRRYSEFLIASLSKDMTHKKNLLLGGSAQQVIAIKMAKEMGYYTVLCDYLPDNPGRYVADKFYQKSTTDVDAVYEIAKTEKVDGILAYASDPAALPAAIVAEKLGLPTNPSKSVAILGVKHLFRHFLKENGFACPQHYHFSSDINIEEFKENISAFHFPIIIKPTDSSGSKGVTKIDSKINVDFDKVFAKAILHADNYSRNKILIVEEFIERGYPFVIGGDIFVVDGKIVLYGEMDCFRDYDGRGLIPIGKRKPCALTEYQHNVLQKELQRLIDLLGIQFGEMNIELILDKEDQPHFLELGPRAGGNMIPIQLSDVFDIDLVKANITVAMGEVPKLDLTENPGCFMHYVLHCYKDGKFAGIEFSPEIEPFIYRKCIYKKDGDAVESFDGASKALGIVFLHFDTMEQMNEFCNRKDELIKVRLQ